MRRFVRVLTSGRGLKAINENVVRAAHGGSRVLVRAAMVAGGLPIKPDWDRGTVAD